MLYYFAIILINFLMAEKIGTTVVCLFLLLESNVLSQLQTDKCEKLTAVIRVLFVFLNIIYLRAIEHGFMRSDEIELTKYV